MGEYLFMLVLLNKGQVLTRSDGVVFIRYNNRCFAVYLRDGKASHYKELQ